MNEIERFELSDGEKLHPLWLRLKAHFESELNSRRKRNDVVTNTEQQTAALRGEIKILKSLIALGDDRPLTGE